MSFIKLVKKYSNAVCSGKLKLDTEWVEIRHCCILCTICPVSLTAQSYTESAIGTIIYQQQAKHKNKIASNQNPLRQLFKCDSIEFPT